MAQRDGAEANAASPPPRGNPPTPLRAWLRRTAALLCLLSFVSITRPHWDLAEGQETRGTAKVRGDDGCDGAQDISVEI